MKAVFDPEKYCPICGRLLPVRDGENGPEPGPHQCPERTLRGIDSAHGREPDEETYRDWPPENQRLAEGLRMVKWDEADDPKTW